MGQEDVCGICGLEAEECKLARRFTKKRCELLSHDTKTRKPWFDQASLLKRANPQHRGLIPRKRQVPPAQT